MCSTKVLSIANKYIYIYTRAGAKGMESGMMVMNKLV